MSLYDSLAAVSVVPKKQIDPMVISRSFGLDYAIVSSMNKRVSESRKSVIPVHVSTAIDLCARQLYYLQQQPEYQVEVTSEEVVLWGLGRAVESILRERIIDIFGQQNIYGRWKCLCGKTELVGFGVNPQNYKCRFCNHSVVTTFDEWAITANGLIVGNPDMLLNLDGQLVITEFKSMSGPLFKTLEAPNQAHVLQVYCYFRILKDHYGDFFKGMGVSISNTPEIIYVSKDYNKYRKTNNIKSFKLDFNESTTRYGWAKDVYDKAFTDIKLVVQGHKPDRTKCDTANCERAKKCPVAVRCFADAN